MRGIGSRRSLIVVLLIIAVPLVYWGVRDRQKAAALNGLGMVYARLGLLERAVDTYVKSLHLVPESIHTRSNLAKARTRQGLDCQRQGDLDGAIVHYSQAVRIWPRYAPAHMRWGTALVEQGEIDAALRRYRKALRVEPENAEIRSHVEEALRLRAGRDKEGARR